MERIGFIGLGRMGRPMASNLLRRGFEVVVHDINPDGVKALTKVGGKSAESIAELTRSTDVVITMLPSGKEVEQVILGPDGILSACRDGQIVMDMSTIEPAVTAKVAAALAACGVGMIDAPVGRLAIHADRGESLFMIGAADVDLVRVRPMLEAMGTTILHCGPVGAGIKTKIVNNYIVIVLCQMNAEALALAQRFGLDLESTLAVLGGTTATNGQLMLNWTNKVLAGDISPGFTIDLAHKDLSLALSAARSEKVPMPVGAAASEMFSLARNGRYATADFSGIVDFLCDAAGIPKPRLKSAPSAIAEPTEVLSRFLDALGAGDIDTALSYIADDVKWWALGPGDLTKADLAGAYAKLFSVLSRIDMTVTRQTNNGEHVSVELRSDYRLKNGETITGSLMHLNATIINGCIVAMNEYIDTRPVAHLLAGHTTAV
jgi:4-hydroxybutyrate dehydrogenase/sulfolactaldehyde 3-reductase